MTRGDSQSVFDEMTQAIVSGKRGAAASAGLTPVGFEKMPMTGREARLLVHGDHPADSYSYDGCPACDERRGITNLGGKHALPFPYDDPQTVLTALDVAEDEINHVLKGIRNLRALYGGDSGPAAPDEPAPDPVKVAEREADARHAARTPFDEDMEAKRLAAQAAVFTKADAGDEPDIGWQCPDHGDEALIEKVGGRTGRKYRKCDVAGCKQFQK